MKLNRNHIFLIGVIITIISVFISKFIFISNSDFAKGEVVDISVYQSTAYNGGTSYYPIVKFSTSHYNVRFRGEENLNYKCGDSVDVIYLKSDITDAKIYSLGGFWFSGLSSMLVLIIVMLLFASIYAFIPKTYIITIKIDRFFRIMNFNKIITKSYI